MKPKSVVCILCSFKLDSLDFSPYKFKFRGRDSVIVTAGEPDVAGKLDMVVARRAQRILAIA